MKHGASGDESPLRRTRGPATKRATRSLIAAAIVAAAMPAIGAGSGEAGRSDSNTNPLVLSRRSDGLDRGARYRLDTTIDASPAVVAAATLRFLTHQDFVPDGQRRVTLERSARGVLGYLYLALPLVSDRDAITWVTWKTAGERHRLSWREVSGRGPAPQPGVVRMPRVRGDFDFVPIRPGHTRLIYEVDVDLGGRLPAALVRRFIPSQIRSQIEGIQRIVGAAKRGDFDATNPFVLED